MAAIAEMPDAEGLTTFFKSVGYPEKNAKKYAKSKKDSVALYGTLKEANIDSEMPNALANLMYEVAKSVPKSHLIYRPTIANMVKDSKLDTKQRISAAAKFLKKITPPAELDMAKLEETCGVGMNMTDDEIVTLIDQVFESVADTLQKERYLFGIAKILPLVHKADPRAKWANGGTLTKTIKKKLEEVLGPRDERDAEMAKKNNKAKGKKKKQKAEKQAKARKDGGGKGKGAEEEKKDYDDDASNTFREAARMEKGFRNTEEMKKKHFEITKGIVRTRFPPEPNGYLHIGHAKSMNLVFKGAYEMLGGVKGQCNLRFDDTNPAAESNEYIDNIKENVNWMGWKPWCVTYSSDHFDTLYEFAERLILEDKCYVCHQSGDEIKACRELRQHNKPGFESPFRNRPVEESLQLFRDMRDGKFKEGEASLRMKIDWQHPNPCMWDPVAYRIKHMPHPHAGDKWCIYPSYDYTHCIIDSLEHIDYSLCTLEFEVRRDSYYWLVDALGLWKALQYEFSRLNIEYTVLSKRKLRQLVETKIVDGWDDPRLPTINGLRRRGFTSEGINAFCDDIGVNRKDNTMVEVARLHYWIRWHLDTICHRRMAVLKPLLVELTNYDEGVAEEVDMPNHPKDKSFGTRKVLFSKYLYVDRDDFREVDEKNFFGLAPGKEVRLKFAYNITCTGFEKDDNGNVTKLLATYDKANTNKCKGKLTFVACGKGGLNEKPASASINLYEELFAVPVPGANGRKWTDDLNPNSLTTVTGYVEAALANTKKQDRFQFDRLGYFVGDDDCTADNLIFNRTLTLKSNK